MREYINYLLNTDLTAIYGMVELLPKEALEAMLDNEESVRQETINAVENNEEYESTKAILDKLYSSVRTKLNELM